MNRLIIIAASILINAAALGVIAAAVDESLTPKGQVYVTELTEQAQLPAFAQVTAGREARGPVAL